MIERHRHSRDRENGIERSHGAPLSSDFSDADRAIDRRIAELARSVRPPAGMEDRIFAASCDVLPGAPAARSSTPLPFSIVSTSGRLARRFGVPLATAAAVGLLVVVTWWSTWQGNSPGVSPRDMAADVVLPVPGAAELGAVRDISWHAADVLDAAYQRISTFVVASEDLRSNADLEAELLGIFPELAAGSINGR